MRKKTETQRQWMQRINDNYEEVEKLQPNFEDFDDYPKWVLNLFPILFSVSHPKLHLKAGQQLTVRQFGSLWGRHYALTAVLRGEVQLSQKTLEEKNRMIAALKQSKPEFTIFCFEKSNHWCPAFVKFVKETLASVCDRPHAEAVTFFQAFSEAIIIKPMDLETDGTMGVSEKIAFVMILEWRTISKLQSVHQLHGILSTALKLHGITIRLKRVEKLCWRIGLKFKGRGRPKNSKIQTKTPAPS